MKHQINLLPLKNIVHTPIKKVILTSKLLWTDNKRMIHPYFR